jgi:hypothetical protein
VWFAVDALIAILCGLDCHLDPPTDVVQIQGIEIPPDPPQPGKETIVKARM